MLVGLHQPHFFPWLGYLDKMAKCDLFLVFDTVQLEKQSPMTRNKILNKMGQEKFITCTPDKEGMYEKPCNRILLKDWPVSRRNIINMLSDSYRKAPCYKEIMPWVEKCIAPEYQTLISLELATMNMARELFDIKTPMKFTSNMTIAPSASTSEHVVNTILAAGGDSYFSGNGARKYMDMPLFENKGVKVVYQTFSYPEYSQWSSATFIPNMSYLDILFNCGILKSRELFWENVKGTAIA